MRYELLDFFFFIAACIMSNELDLYTGRIRFGH